MKRSMILLTLMTLFLTVVVGIVGCGLSTDTAGDNLASSAGGGNGPGSGNWQPANPTNERQYQRLHQNVNRLAEESVKLGDQYVQMIRFCYDKEGNRIEDTNREVCNRSIKDVDAALNNNLKDFRAGYVAFATCDCSHLGSLRVQLPDQIGGFPLVLQDNVPTVVDHKSDDVIGKTDTAWTGCLTCTYNINGVEYAFIDLNVDIAQFVTE